MRHAHAARRLLVNNVASLIKAICIQIVGGRPPLSQILHYCLACRVWQGRGAQPGLQ